ncbi:Na(+)/H(+) antiporter subunit B [Thioalkalivibrio sp.]|uniref:Na(+)/H(+) antiporter subunit B n=1 Tax=Thioalkalivibrio sp. TaxID=2093813 RepID=UPI00356A2C63
MPWLDLLLGFTLCITAGLALIARDMFRAVIMFIVFGLLMAVAWVRLQAPDIALAEAAIGAGLTGVLLLDTLGYLRRPFGSRVDDPEDRS